MNIRTSPDIHPGGDLTEEIRREAYLLWKREGCPAVRELDHWLEAQECVRHRQHLPHLARLGDRAPIVPDGDRLATPIEPRGPPSRARSLLLKSLAVAALFSMVCVGFSTVRADLSSLCVAVGYFAVAAIFGLAALDGYRRRLVDRFKLKTSGGREAFGAGPAHPPRASSARPLASPGDRSWGGLRRHPGKISRRPRPRARRSGE